MLPCNKLKKDKTGSFNLFCTDHTKSNMRTPRIYVLLIYEHLIGLVRFQAIVETEKITFMYKRQITKDWGII